MTHLAADLARVGFVAGVRAPVHGQVAVLAEGLPAKGALIGHLARVRAQVHLQAVLGPEPLPAGAAQMRFLSQLTVSHSDPTL